LQGLMQMADIIDASHFSLLTPSKTVRSPVTVVGTGT